jgi:hypothetical protein
MWSMIEEANRNTVVIWDIKSRWETHKGEKQFLWSELFDLTTDKTWADKTISTSWSTLAIQDGEFQPPDHFQFREFLDYAWVIFSFFTMWKITFVEFRWNSKNVHFGRIVVQNHESGRWYDLASNINFVQKLCQHKLTQIFQSQSLLSKWFKYRGIPEKGQRTEYRIDNWKHGMKFTREKMIHFSQSLSLQRVSIIE